MKSIRKFILILSATILAAGCGGSDPVNQNQPGAPRILDLKVDPEVICVGSSSEITFEVIDPNQDAITWTIKLSTNIHGTPEKSSGTDTSGAHLDVRFKAATSGRHRHRVTLTISAVDPGGLQADPVSKELFVFNCS